MMDALVSALLVVAALWLGAHRGPGTRARPATRILLVAWHTAWAFVYWQYAKVSVADATLYLVHGATSELQLAVGTGFVNSLCVILVRYLGLSELNAYLAFNLAGALGLLLLQDALWDAVGDAASGPARLARQLVWLPGFAFWSVAPGKDGLALLGVAIAVRASLDERRRWPGTILGAACLGLVRPHMGALLVVAALLAQLIGRQRGRHRLLALWALGVVSALVVPFALEYAGLGGLEGIGDVTSYVEQRQSLNVSGGSSFELSSMSTPEQLFAFMFRPLFFDAPGLTGLVVSVENLVLVAFVALAGLAALRGWRELGGYAARFNLVYGMLGWLVLAVVTANLGIAVRQKTMVLPSLLVAGALSLAGAARRRGSARRDAIGTGTPPRPSPSTPGT